MKSKICSICLGGLLSLALFLSYGFFSVGLADPPFSKQLLTEQNHEVRILVKYQGETEPRIIIVAANQIKRTISRYENDPGVEYAEPEVRYRATALPNDILFKEQWYLNKIKAPAAWNKATKAPNITIAIIDSGVQIDHPDLKDNVWKNIKEIPDNGIDDDHNGFIDDVSGWDFLSGTNDPNPKIIDGDISEEANHGTVVAGIAAASGNNNAGIAGVAWQAKIMPLRVLDDRGEGRTGDVIKAIDYAINNGADVINLSFVGPDYSQSLHEAIKRAYQAGVIVVAAAGQEQGQTAGINLDKYPMYPVCDDGVNGENMVIGVTATDSLDQKLDFSNYGRCVDIAAPGYRIFSTTVYNPLVTNSRYYNGYWSGTSMAAPMVSGAIALVKEINPRLKPEELKTILLNTSYNINRLNPQYDGKLGRGRLDLEMLVDTVYQGVKSATAKLVIIPPVDRENKIKIVDPNGKDLTSFAVFDQKFKGSFNVAAGDLNEDGSDELIIGVASGGAPQVKIFDQEGKMLRQFLAYNNNFKGGINVIAADLDGNNKNKIIVGLGAGDQPLVRIFSSAGKLQKEFKAFPANFRGGVKVAAGDLDGDGKDEIIVAPALGGGPQVRIFNQNGKLLGQLFAFEANWRGGINLSVGNVIKLGRVLQDEIIVAPLAGRSPQVKIFDNHGQLISSFLAYAEKFKGGVNLALADTNADGLEEVITGAGSGGSPHVRVFKTGGVLLNSFYAYEENYNKGVKVGAVRSPK